MLIIIGSIAHEFGSSMPNALDWFGHNTKPQFSAMQTSFLESQTLAFPFSLFHQLQPEEGGYKMLMTGLYSIQKQANTLIV